MEIMEFENKELALNLGLEKINENLPALAYIPFVKSKASSPRMTDFRWHKELHCAQHRDFWD